MTHPHSTVICLDLGGSFIKLGMMDAQDRLTLLDQQKSRRRTGRHFAPESAR